MAKKTILLDDREKPHVIKEAYNAFPGQVKVKRLFAGDINYKELCIERKSGGDLPASLTDGRLKQQAKKMKESFALPYIFFIGDGRELCKDEHFDWFNEKTFEGVVASMSVGFGVPIIVCRDDNHFWYRVKRYIEKYDKYHGDNPVSLLQNELTYKPDKIMSPEENMLCAGVPGIGPTRASAILREYAFPDLYHITERDLQKVSGIGVRFAKQIKEVFDGSRIKGKI